MADDKKFIVCNYAEATNIARNGALVYVIPQFGGNMPERIRILARSRGGRWVEKWESIKRLENFRLKSIPEANPRYSDNRIWEGNELQVSNLILSKIEVMMRCL